mmetsp:Transcript_2158/g.5472  ORF Transcript_2158/g.5472 Transcript_2158/m.5472 type:complete len:546 (-) Transcript_2158:122-1759(-)|eukprot:CAMPEP_0202870046 /NCGR_PEP_ID=MMETSP1391-20130828/14422_1 /ASSEMBLY_ACC=CAM_ASM_000867 /TAXON_ID=1034604 /ORGANISM="Chlamydomonas leiostraca, Strain SAG 11-49" /LENGTH=545 /DNA_ID=CAMNT_0049550477 /DNA_START=70 /DNA_END=1707 /DNA_ORIENTATION=-
MASRASAFLESQGLGKLATQLARLQVYEVEELKEVAPGQLSSILGLTSPQVATLSKSLEDAELMSKAKLQEAEGLASLAATCIIHNPKGAVAPVALEPLGLEALSGPLADLGVKAAGDLADLDPEAWGQPSSRAKLSKVQDARWRALMTAVALEVSRAAMGARWRGATQGKVVEAFRLQGHTAAIWGVAASPDGKALASASGDDTLRMWQIHDAARLKDGASVYLSGKVVGARHVAFTWDSATIVCGTERGEVKVFDAATLKLKRSWDALKAGADEDGDGEDDADTEMAGMALSGDARYVACVFKAPGAVKVFDFKTGKLSFVLAGHKGDVNAVAFCPDHHTLVTGSSDKTLKVWDCKLGSKVGEFSGHTGAVMALAVSHNGKWLVSGGADKKVCVYDMAGAGKGGAAVAPAHTLSGPAELVRSVAITHDSKCAIAGSDDATLHIWDLVGPTGGAPGKPLAPALATTVKNVHPGRDHNKINAIIFTPDTRTLVTGGRDNGIIRLWRVQADDNRDIKAAVGGMSMRASGSGGGRSIAGIGSGSAKY